MKTHYPEGDLSEYGKCYTYPISWTMARIRQECEDDLTRSNTMKHASMKDLEANLGAVLPFNQVRSRSSKCGDSITLVIPSALALFDANDQAFAVNVEDLKQDHLVGLGQRRRQRSTALYFQLRAASSSRHRVALHFLDVQHRWQFTRLMLDDLGPPERDLKKEPQRRDGLIDGRPTDTACPQM